MSNITEYLIQLANTMDQKGQQECANAVDKLLSDSSLVKVAQYVGAIGYVLKQNRAMSNCLRQKRTASDRSMQEIIMECLSEYQDGQDYQDTEWTSKYAQVIEKAPDQFEQVHHVFIETLASSNGINDHVHNVEEVNSILYEHGQSDGLIHTVLSHLSMLDEELKKEGSSGLPFKLAYQPRSRRPGDRWAKPGQGGASDPYGWTPGDTWSDWWKKHITAPSEFSVANPFSWSQERRQKGATADALEDAEQLRDVLQRIRYISNRNSQLLQNTPQTGNPALDTPLQQLVNSVGAMDLPQASNAVSSLNKTIQELSAGGTEGLEPLGKLVSNFSRSLPYLERYVNHMWTLLKDVSQREALNEFGVAKQRLTETIQNVGRSPLDTTTYEAADAAIGNVISTLQGARPQDMPTPEMGEEAEPSIPGAGEPTEETPETEVSIESIESAARNLANAIQNKAEVASALGAIMTSREEAGELDPSVRAFLGTLGEELSPSSVPGPVAPGTPISETPAEKPPTEPPPITPPKRTGGSRTESLSLSKMGERYGYDVTKLSEDEVHFLERFHSSVERGRMSAKETLALLTDVVEEEFLPRPHGAPVLACGFLDDLVKIANAADKVDPKISDIIDTYIKDLSIEDFEKIQIPEVAKLVRDVVEDKK